MPSGYIARWSSSILESRPRRKDLTPIGSQCICKHCQECILPTYTTVWMTRVPVDPTMYTYLPDLFVRSSGDLFSLLDQAKEHNPLDNVKTDFGRSFAQVQISLSNGKSEPNVNSTGHAKRCGRNPGGREAGENMFVRSSRLSDSLAVNPKSKRTRSRLVQSITSTLQYHRKCLPDCR